MRDNIISMTTSDFDESSMVNNIFSELKMILRN